MYLEFVKKPITANSDVHDTQTRLQFLSSQAANSINLYKCCTYKALIHFYNEWNWIKITKKIIKKATL